MSGITIEEPTVEVAETKQGSFFEQDNYRIEVKYSEEAKSKELMKFILKEGTEFEIPAHDLLLMIAENIKKNELALALSKQEVSMKQIYMANATRQINFTMDRDVPKGEVISFEFTHPYPYFLLLLEEGYKLAKTDGKVEAVPMESIEEVQKMMDLNKELAETINKPTLEKLKAE